MFLQAYAGLTKRSLFSGLLFVAQVVLVPALLTAAQSTSTPSEIVEAQENTTKISQPPGQAESETQAPPSSGNVNDPLARLNPQLPSELDKIEEQIDQQEDALQELRHQVTTYVTVGALLLAIAGILGIGYFRRRLRRVLDPIINRIAKERLDAAVESVKPSLLKRMEDDLIRFARVLALVDSKKYDAALNVYGWAGSVADLRSEEPVLRRAVIECLFSGAGRNDEERKENRRLAWQATQELVRDQDEIPELKLFLRMATKLGRYEDGEAVVRKYKDILPTDMEAGSRAATVLRRRGRHEEALKLLAQLKPTNDYAVIVTRASLHRDLGQLEEAHSLLLPSVERILNVRPERLTEAESRVINTFLANCIDRGQPSDAMEAGRLVLERVGQPRPVEIATVGRLLLAATEADHKIDQHLMEEYERRVGELPPSYRKVHSEIHLLRLQNKQAAAEQRLTQEIETLAQLDDPNETQTRNAYYFRCLLGQLLLERAEHDHASEVLLKAARERQSGEGCFLMAKAEAARGDERDAVTWIRQAVEILPRWRKMAYKDQILRQSGSVMTELRQDKEESA